MEGPPLRVLYKRISHFNGQYCKIYWNGLVLSGNINLIPYGKRLIIKTPERYIVVYFGISGTVKRKNINGEKPSMVIVSERSVSLFFTDAQYQKKHLMNSWNIMIPERTLWIHSGILPELLLKLISEAFLSGLTFVLHRTSFLIILPEPQNISWSSSISDIMESVFLNALILVIAPEGSHCGSITSFLGS